MGVVNLQDAVQMASLTPAKVLGIDDKKGSLETGKDADIVVMDRNYDIDMTIIAGEIIKVNGKLQNPNDKIMTKSK